MSTRYNSDTQVSEARNPIIFINNTFANNSSAGYYTRGGGIHGEWYQNIILFNNIFSSLIVLSFLSGLIKKRICFLTTRSPELFLKHFFVIVPAEVDQIGRAHV